MLTAHVEYVNNFFSELHSKRIYFGSDTHQIKTAIEVLASGMIEKSVFKDDLESTCGKLRSVGSFPNGF